MQTMGSTSKDIKEKDKRLLEGVIQKKKKKQKGIKPFVNKVIQGDCLNILPSIPDKSIDMILCDLPYGTTQNKWDSVIDLQALWGNRFNCTRYFYSQIDFKQGEIIQIQDYLDQVKTDQLFKCQKTTAS